MPFILRTTMGIAIYIAAALFLCNSLYRLIAGGYAEMLAVARTPLHLRYPIGGVVLWVFLQISTLMRWLLPSLANRIIQTAANDKADKLIQQKPRPGGICFIGSSTFTYWQNLEVDITQALYGSINCNNRPKNELTVFNAGFGGSCTHDILQNVEKLCMNYAPRVIVYFCGSNNLSMGLTPDSVQQGFEAFLKRLFILHDAQQQDADSSSSSSKKAVAPRTNHRRLGQCKIHVIYLSITTTPFFRDSNINNSYIKALAVNKQMKRFCHESTYKNQLTFVDTTTTGNASKDENLKFLQDFNYYLGDHHHLNDQGHKLLAQVLAPAIRLALAKTDQ